MITRVVDYLSWSGWISTSTAWVPSRDMLPAGGTQADGQPMKAVGFTEFGGPEVLRTLEVDDPHAGSGQVRVKVERST